jgi:hypothetical protein
VWATFGLVAADINTAAATAIAVYIRSFRKKSPTTSAEDIDQPPQAMRPG